MSIVTVDCREHEFVSLRMYRNKVNKYETLRKSVLPIMEGIPKGHGCAPQKDFDECKYLYPSESWDDCELFKFDRPHTRKNPRKLKACRNLCKLMGWE